MAAIVGSVAWHVRRVVASRRRADAAAYVASRLLLLGWFAGSAAVLRRQGVDMHLHHLYLGGCLLLLASLLGNRLAGLGCRAWGIVCGRSR